MWAVRCAPPTYRKRIKSSTRRKTLVSVFHAVLVIPERQTSRPPIATRAALVIAIRCPLPAIVTIGTPVIVTAIATAGGGFVLQTLIVLAGLAAAATLLIPYVPRAVPVIVMR